MIELPASGGVLLLLDQWSKRTVEARFANRGVSLGWLLQIRCVRNLKNVYRCSGTRAILVVIWLAAFASGLVLYRMGVSFQSHTALIGLGSALGGAAGNFLDIWRHRSIVDFIDLGWWPVFNLADVAITAGIILAFWT